MTYQQIEQAYICARKNKARSYDAVLFEQHWAANLQRLLDAVNARTLYECMDGNYCFITLRPRPREIFASEMGIRILHHYIDIRMRPLMESLFTSRTFNNRRTMGVDACINQCITDDYEASQGYTKMDDDGPWVVKWDLSGYFPNANLDIVYNQMIRLVDTAPANYYADGERDDLLYIIRYCVYAYPQKHCYRKSPLRMWQYISPDKSLFNKPDGIGGAIGNLIWQNAMNLYQHEIDVWMTRELGLLYCRFVDDSKVVLRSRIEKDWFLANIMPELRKRLSAIGCRPNEKKFYCQPLRHGYEMLGSHIKCDRVYLNKRTYRRAIKLARDAPDLSGASDAEMTA